MAEDPVLARLRSTLEEMYGDNLDRVVLFGSRARGDARADSDYDIAIFLKALADRWAERRRLGDLRHQLMEETGQFLDAMAFPAEMYRKRTPLMWDIRSQGKTL